MAKEHAQPGKPARPKQIRLWPGVISAVLLVLVKFIVPIVIPGTFAVSVFGAIFFALVIVVWWTAFSRARWFDRVGAVGFMIAGILVTAPFLHESIGNAGQGFLFPIHAVPVMSAAFALCAAACHGLSEKMRRTALAAVILLSCGAWVLIRTGGIDNEGRSDLDWRWTQSPEEALLAELHAGSSSFSAPAGAAEMHADWPGFRGPGRDGIVRGTRIGTDWTVSPPKELWRRPVGPGWSSFALSGGLFYTQEQRGEEEIVACYQIMTGRPVWMHTDSARFWESNGGAGPRGTPTLYGGRVYTLGGTGIVNVLDADAGTVIWSRNAGTDTDTKVPTWGFSGSPLVVDDLVIVAAGGSLIAYDPDTGEPRWLKTTESGDCYSSPHLVHTGGVRQVLLQHKTGTVSVLPEDGTVLWEHAWEGYPIVQPAVTDDGDILLSVDERSGIRRIHAENGPDGWSVTERWTSNEVKPYFNDSVIHKGHIYGFNGRSVACMDLEGQRKWKGGVYNRGQLVLLADQDLLLVVSEQGDIALVKAVPEAFTELARMPAITGKTWNHPVVTGELLLVRNAEEMAAFRLPSEG
ncbi:PQQ-binding-like beta-propeller repeat protein [bacterium]|nr:PQQ-binding-like beta-propeller repeat protein [bacterium]